MDFIRQLKAFDEIGSENLTPNAIAIYYHLFMLNNRCGWKEWFDESDYWIGRAVGIRRRETILAAINLLKQKGFIDFERGSKRNQSTKYKIIELSTGTILPHENSAEDSAKHSVKDSPKDSAKHSPKHSAKDSGNIKQETQTKTETETKQSTPARVDVFASSGESERVKALLKDFDEMRKKKKNPMTDKAKQLLLKKLDELSGGDEFMKIHLLEQSIEHGWQSVYPLKNDLSTSPQRKTRLQENMEAADRAIAFFESQEANRNDEGNGDSQASQTVYDGFPF